MKKCLPFLFFLLSFSSLKALDASISYATFKGPQQNYIEIYLHVVGNTVNYRTMADSTHVQAAVEVLILFKRRGEIAKYDKYRLNSPECMLPIDFIDQRRFGLEDGSYQLEVSVKDLNMADNSKSFDKVISLNFDEEEVQQSDIQLLSSYKEDSLNTSFTKNGFYLESLPFNFYDRYSSKLIFYNEVYNTSKMLDEQFLIRYIIEKVDNNGETETVMIGNKKRDPKAINVILLQKDISKLRSGNYNLVVEVRNRNDELLSSKSIFFQRSNPLLNTDEMDALAMEEEFVASLNPEELQYSLRAIAMNVKNSDVEVLNLVIASNNPEQKKRFLFNFWAGQNPNNPKLSYEQYMNVAKAVDKLYQSGFGFGFETDRGYTFMKYGKPHDVLQVDNDPSAPPYEIWVYNNLAVTNQALVKFLFYNPSLDGVNFTMLHSTARGEVNNPQWEIDLYRDAPDEVQGSNFIDATSMKDNFQRQARQLFNDF